MIDNVQAKRRRFVSATRAREAAGVEQAFDRGDVDDASAEAVAVASSGDAEVTASACGSAIISSMVDRRVGLRRMPRSLPMMIQTGSSVRFSAGLMCYSI